MNRIDEPTLRTLLVQAPPAVPDRPGFGAEIARRGRNRRRRARASLAVDVAVVALIGTVGLVQLRSPTVIAEPYGGATMSSAPGPSSATTPISPRTPASTTPVPLAAVTARDCPRQRDQMLDRSANVRTSGNATLVRCRYRAVGEGHGFRWVRQPAVIIDDPRTVAEIVAQLAGTPTDMKRQFCGSHPFSLHANYLAARQADGRIGIVRLDYCSDYSVDGEAHWLTSDAWQAIVRLTPAS